ncbi:hypothetical protein ACFVUS_12825 [Nocardia sp. NPDC058058]|uniref:hypothetical protein n=1 Tax=Nocardia sp. NPDC058058 TaxID=3346317 RepID=UPI0036D78C76
MPATTLCDHPIDPTRILSRHRTSEGVITYTRCHCGTIRMWLSPNTFGTPVTLR